MNLFAGLTNNQIISFVISGAVFTGYAALVALSLYAFRTASRPINGRVRTAAAWHFLALLFFIGSIITEVWAAPAEKSFVAADNDALLDVGRLLQDPNARLQKVLIGVILAGIGILCMIAGAAQGGRQKRQSMADHAYAPLPPVDSPRAASASRI